MKNFKILIPLFLSIQFNFANYDKEMQVLNNQIAMKTICDKDEKSLQEILDSTEKTCIDETGYLQFMENIFKLLDSDEISLIKRSGLFVENIVEMRKFRTPKGFIEEEFWINQTLINFNGNERLFNIWTLKRAIRLFNEIKLWKKIIHFDESEIENIRLPDKYPALQTNKTIITIGDVHGDLNQFIFPLINEGICKITGNLILYDTLNHRRAPINEITRKNIGNYILLPELDFIEGAEDKFIVQFLGDFLDRGEWTDECWFLFEELSIRAPNGLISSVIGNHDASILNDKHDLLSGYIYARKMNIRSGAIKLVIEGKLTLADNVAGILVSHSYTEDNFIKVLLENLDANISIDLLGFLGKPEKYQNIQQILEKLLKTTEDKSIILTFEEKQLYVDFINDIFRRCIELGDSDIKKVFLKLFWINNGGNPDTLTNFFNPLWIYRNGKIVNVPMMIGHFKTENASYELEIYDGSRFLKLAVDVDGSYAINGLWYSMPRYFKIYPNGEVQTTGFKDPKHVFGVVKEKMELDKLFPDFAKILLFSEDFENLNIKQMKSVLKSA